MKTNRVKQGLVRQLPEAIAVFSDKSSAESRLLPLIPLGSVSGIALNERMKGDS